MNDNTSLETRSRNQIVFNIFNFLDGNENAFNFLAASVNVV